MENPVKKVFYTTPQAYHEARMTIDGALSKIGLLAVALISGSLVGWQLFTFYPSLSPIINMSGALFLFALGMITVFSPERSRYTALPYAFGQGLVVMMASLYLEQIYPSLPLTALILTFATACAMLICYRLQLIRVTQTVRSMIISATGAIALTYLFVFLGGLFGFPVRAFFSSSSELSIIFSFFVIGVASFNLLLDFDLIEQGVEQGFPRYMEWYSAFSLLVTLIWLYWELVRLLIKLSSRKRR